MKVLGILIVATLVGVAWASTSERCEQLKHDSKCFCDASTSTTEYDIQCMRIKTTIRITSKSVLVDCNQMRVEDYSNDTLPYLEIGEVQTVQIRKCPLPPDQSVYGIMRMLGITKINGLLFESMDMESQLSKMNFQHLDNISRLRISANSLKVLPENLFEDLNNLTWLTIRSNTVQLPKKIFQSSPKLEYLELTHNNLKDLDSGIFENLKNLKHLSLWSNNLTNLTKNAFVGASSIRDLDLSANGIETLKADVFFHLKNLTEINLSANHFQSLPRNIFTENKQLTKLRLQNNRIPLTTLPPRMLADLPLLTEISITCDLIQLPGDLLENSEKLIEIKLNMNKMVSLPPTLFGSQSNLEKLDLSNNQLVELPDELFENTTSLVELKLQNNQLVNISRVLFSNLKKLTYLNLKNNKIATIHQHAFDHELIITHIDLSNNMLYDKISYENMCQTSQFSSLKDTLEDLNLSNNKVACIFDDWRHIYTNLANLDLSHNNIYNLKDVQFLSSTDIVRKVNLSHNKIYEIDFKLIEFTLNTSTFKVDIDLNNNPLDCNCFLLAFNQFLRHKSNYPNHHFLKLKTDQLSCAKPQNLENHLIKDVDPKRLVCDLDPKDATNKSCPEDCSCFVRPFDNFLVVNCTNTDKFQIPGLPNVTRYEKIELDISNNHLSRLPSAGEIKGYGNVVKLLASNNNISFVDVASFPHSLNVIDLTGNNLQRFDKQVLAHFNKTATEKTKHFQMLLSDNKWICDCTTTDFIAFTQSHFRSISDYKDMQCWNTGDFIAEITVDNICKADKTLYIAGGLLLALSGLIIGLMAAFYYKYQQEIKVWMYAHNVFMWWVSEEDLDKDKKYDAFISYSHKDETFVEELMKRLECGENPYKLCLHFRDWKVGEYISTQIATSVEESRRTIVVLSKNFLESVWARNEFKTAHLNSVSEGRARVIVIIYGDIGDTEKLDPELKAYLKTNTYVKWGDPWFWDKLKYALPHKNVPNNTKRQSGHMNGVIVDDKLELIKQNSIISIPPLTTPPAEHAGKQFNGSIVSQQPNGHVGHNNHINQTFHGLNGHINGAFIINTNAKQSDV